jgi:HEAT repeat protein
MSLSFALCAAFFVCSPEVSDSDWSRAESAFASQVKKSDVRVRREAAQALAAVADQRAARLLWHTIEKQVKSIDDIGADRAEREERLAKAEKLYEKTGYTSRGLPGRRSSSGGDELKKLRDGVRQAIDRETQARATLDCYAEAVATSLSHLDGDEYVAAFGILRDTATSTKFPLGLRAAAIHALANVEASEARDVLSTILASDTDREVRVLALEAVAQRKDPEAADRVIASLGDEAWQVRAAAIRALVEIKSKRAITPLIDALEHEKGRLVDDLEKALVALTGHNFHSSTTQWREWWANEGPSFAVLGTPEAEAIAKAAKAASPSAAETKAVPQPPTTSFYGIETRSLHVLFVLDVSGSMAEATGPTPTGPSKTTVTKLAAAHAEIHRALAALPEAATFDILVYSSDVQKWSATMAAATTKNKEAAEAWVRAIPAKGSTNCWAGLAKSFEIAGIGTTDKNYRADADTIFFLTDGNPTVGAITDVECMLREVRRLNALSRVVIHTVGVGNDANNDFLGRLASENGGKHVKK